MRRVVDATIDFSVAPHVGKRYLPLQCPRFPLGIRFQPWTGRQIRGLRPDRVVLILDLSEFLVSRADR